MSQQFAFYSSECSLEHLQTPELSRAQEIRGGARFALPPDSELVERPAHLTVQGKSAKLQPERRGYFTELTELPQSEAPVEERLFSRSQFVNKTLIRKGKFSS